MYLLLLLLLTTRFALVSCLADSSETSVHFQHITWRYVPEARLMINVVRSSDPEGCREVYREHVFAFFMLFANVRHCSTSGTEHDEVTGEVSVI